MISEEQAKLVAEYVKSASHADCVSVHEEVSDELFAAACKKASATPDLRADRLKDARRRLDSGEIDSHQIAEKMLTRILGDHLASRTM